MQGKQEKENPICVHTDVIEDVEHMKILPENVVTRIAYSLFHQESPHEERKKHHDEGQCSHPSTLAAAAPETIRDDGDKATNCVEAAVVPDRIRLAACLISNSFILNQRKRAQENERVRVAHVEDDRN